MITGSINVMLIDKTRLFPGAKGKYLDFVLIELREPDKRGNDYMIVESITKEEREKGIRGTILGNARTVSRSNPGRNIAKSGDDSGRRQAEPPVEDDTPF